jgi:hypothetical protein
MKISSTKANFSKVLAAGMAVALAATLLVVLVRAKPAEAAFPGTNGKIAFVSDRNDPNAGSGDSTACEIFTMNPDGFGQTNLTNNTNTCEGHPLRVHN